MPRKKSQAARIRINKQIRSETGQFIVDEDKYSDNYSEDTSDDEYIDERTKNLYDFTLIWSNVNYINKKIKIPYMGNSKSIKYHKYGPSEDFTKAAKLSQPITNFFTKKMKISKI